MMTRNKYYTALWLAAGYICLQMVADITAAKMVQFWGIALPAGSMVFALTFTWRDMVHKRLGKQAAQILIIAALCTNLFMALYFMYVVRAPYPVWWEGQEAVAFVMNQVPRIVIASICAEFASEWLDTELYHFWVTKVTTKYQWSRVIFSNLFSVPLDSIIFAAIAFYGVMPLAALVGIVWGQSLWKWLVTIVSMPGIYLIKERPRNDFIC